MSWKISSTETERRRFVEAWQRQTMSIEELAPRFGISPKTGRKFIRRFKEEGWEGLKDRSRARLTQARTDDLVVARLVDVRRAHPTWGPRKVRDFLMLEEPELALPAASTIGDIYRREGLLGPRQRRRQSGVPPTHPCVEATAPNDSWSMDHKGDFLLGDRSRCFPFTLTDNFSRYIFKVQTESSTSHERVWVSLLAAFREHGLPRAIRSDNGFAGKGLTRLSRLSVQLIRLGVFPDFIAPAKPQQNGRHERMHRTLKAETLKPPASTMRLQQRRFDNFVEVFNCQRPHEALGGKRPADVHRPSARQMPSRVPHIEYADGSITRAINGGGCFKWRSEFYFLAEPLEGERVAFEPLDDGLYLVRFGAFPIAVFDEKAKDLRSTGPRRRAQREPMCPV